MNTLIERDLTVAQMKHIIHERIEAHSTNYIVVAQLMYDALRTRGIDWVFVPHELSTPNNLIWRTFSALVEGAGGQRAQHSTDETGNVYDFNKSFATTLDYLNRKFIAPNQITGNQCNRTTDYAQLEYAKAIISVEPDLAAHHELIINSVSGSYYARLIFAELKSEGRSWIWVPMELSNQAKQVWRHFQQLVVSGGGQKLRHNYWLGDQRLYGNLYDFRGTFKTIAEKKIKWVAGYQITNSEVTESSNRIRSLYDIVIQRKSPLE